jgi:hypothetical protein
MLPSPSTRSLKKAVLLVPSVTAAMLMALLSEKKMPLGFGSPRFSPRATTKMGMLPLELLEVRGRAVERPAGPGQAQQPPRAGADEAADAEPGVERVDGARQPGQTRSSCRTRMVPAAVRT